MTGISLQPQDVCIYNVFKSCIEAVGSLIPCIINVCLLFALSVSCFSIGTQSMLACFAWIYLYDIIYALRMLPGDL